MSYGRKLIEAGDDVSVERTQAAAFYVCIRDHIQEPVGVDNSKHASHRA